LIEERSTLTELPDDPIPGQGAGPHFGFGPTAKITLAPASEIDA
jgi:hypothetical protein